MKPAKRFLLSGLALVVVVTALAAIGVIWQTRLTTQARVQSRLQVAASVEAALQSTRLEVLQAHAQALATDQAFVGYVAHALLPDPAFGGQIDSASIGDLLKQRRHGYAVAMVLDREGKPVAASGILRKDPASIAHDKLVTLCLVSGKAAQGMWVAHGQLLWVAVNPLLRGGTIQGMLLTATPVSDAFAIAVSRIAGVDVALVTRDAPGSISASSTGMSLWATRALTANASAIVDVQSAHGQAVPLSDQQHATTAWATPLNVVDGRAAMLAIDPDADTRSLVDSAAWPILGGVAALGIFAALLIVLQWQRTWLPLERMQELILRAADGDHFMHVRDNGSPIVRYLRDAINQLLGQYRV